MRQKPGGTLRRRLGHRQDPASSHPSRAQADRPASVTLATSAAASRELARDFGAREITVNVVQPGPTDTDMNPAEGPRAGEMHAQMAIKRHGTADELAALVAFLAGPDARGITGAMHTIDGGFGA